METIQDDNLLTEDDELLAREENLLTEDDKCSHLLTEDDLDTILNEEIHELENIESQDMNRELQNIRGFFTQKNASFAKPLDGIQNLIGSLTSIFAHKEQTHFDLSDVQTLCEETASEKGPIFDYVFNLQNFATSTDSYFAYHLLHIVEGIKEDALHLTGLLASNGIEELIESPEWKFHYVRMCQGMYNVMIDKVELEKRQLIKNFAMLDKEKNLDYVSSLQKIRESLKFHVMLF